MEGINYIKHLNGVLAQFAKDNRLNPTHISLYIGLFQLWNHNYFVTEFHICREEAMAYAKIGSKSTYHRCIRELSHWNYILYTPSHNPYKGSRIKMFDFGTSTGQAVDRNHTIIGTSNGQALVPINKPIQTFKNNTNGSKRRKIKKKIFQIVETKGQQVPTVPYRDNLRTTEDKDYNEPL
ncbi:hypothetical protein F8C76_02055 [Flagellimonas olearia]|uniref:Uncharacterized protein n=1 Tax=Flagellimonas olearia TaxID=552546 RepID=A0A6I1E9B9_9FLAO|nr:hypothetical protein [Allomuricauda olearia]KAB7530314.1 hypothetical protein F8C76_02055 [Allomuricauda olearia]